MTTNEIEEIKYGYWYKIKSAIYQVSLTNINFPYENNENQLLLQKLHQRICMYVLLESFETEIKYPISGKVLIDQSGTILWNHSIVHFLE